MAQIFMHAYTSQFSRPMSDEDIKKILEVSQKNNLRDGITGFLTVRAGYFLQLLEGDEAKVKDCYERISLDPRHKLLTVQGEAFSEERMMPTWSMGLVKADEKLKSSQAILELFELGRAGKPFSNNTSLISMLKIFSKEAQVLV